jgi:hypothetical protein
MSLSDNPTPVFEGNDCSDIFWSSENDFDSFPFASLDKITTNCMEDLITIAGSAMAGASNVTAVNGKRANGESCVAHYDGKQHGVAIVNGEFMTINYEMVCDGTVNKVLDGLFCKPSSCGNTQSVAVALNEITHAEEVNPYFAFLYFSWNYKANCKWVYRVPQGEQEEEKEEAIWVDGMTNSARGNETVLAPSESSSSAAGMREVSLFVVWMASMTFLFTIMGHCF